MKKYKIGDKVWIKEDLVLGTKYDGIYYQINYGEKDIRGKLVTITKLNGDRYWRDDYKNFGHSMIDHEKAKQKSEVYEYWDNAGDGTTTTLPLTYEIY